MSYQVYIAHPQTILPPALSPSQQLSAEKVRGKDVELRCPFPPPGLAVAGEDLDGTTVEGVGLCPRGRLMVQFRWGGKTVPVVSSGVRWGFAAAP